MWGNFYVYIANTMGVAIKRKKQNRPGFLSCLVDHPDFYSIGPVPHEDQKSHQKLSAIIFPFWILLSQNLS